MGTLRNLDLAQTTYHRLHGSYATIDELMADSVARTLLQDTTGLEVHADSEGWWA